MSYVTFEHTDSITIDVPVECEWAAPGTGRDGSATLTLPYGSPAADAAYINPLGGSLLRVIGEADSSDWRGVIHRPNFTQRGVELSAVELTALLARWPVDLNHVFTNISAEDIVRRALAAGPLPVGGIAQSGPHIEGYEFHGEPIWDHVRAMSERSDAELIIDDDYRLHWGGTGHQSYGTLLNYPKDVAELSWAPDVLDQAIQVTALSDQASATRTLVGLQAGASWGAHVVVKTPASDQLGAIAEAELARRGRPLETMTAAVTQAHWGIRCGITVQIYVPWAAFTGRIVTGLVIARRRRANSTLMGLELQAIGPDPGATVGVMAAPPALAGIQTQTVASPANALRDAIRQQRFGRAYLLLANR